MVWESNAIRGNCLSMHAPFNYSCAADSRCLAVGDAWLMSDIITCCHLALPHARLSPDAVVNITPAFPFKCCQEVINSSHNATVRTVFAFVIGLWSGRCKKVPTRITYLHAKCFNDLKSTPTPLTLMSYIFIFCSHINVWTWSSRMTCDVFPQYWAKCQCCVVFSWAWIMCDNQNAAVKNTNNS